MCDPFCNPTIEVVTFRLRGWCMRSPMMHVAGVYPSRTWMSGSFESVRWNACVHRLDLGLYSHPKEFWGEWSRNPCQPQGKNPLYRKKNSPQRRIEPTTLHQTGQRSQHTTNELFRPLSQSDGSNNFQVPATRNAGINPIYLCLILGIGLIID